MFGLFSGVGNYLKMGMAAVILIGGGFGYWYYKDSQATIYTLNQNIATLEANAVALEGAIDTLNGTVLTLEKQRKIDQVKIDKLSNEYRDSRAKVNDLRRTLSKHDIGYLAQEKPGLVENIVNRGTKKVGEELERLSQPEVTP
mgnify:CR=1 FL=1